MMTAVSLPSVMSLGQILPEGFGATVDSANRQIGISHLASASQAVVPGTLFCACKGLQHHGMSFADQAIQQGAIAIVCETDSVWPDSRIQEYAEQCPIPVFSLAGLSSILGHMAARFYDHPSTSLQPIGITGTNGKTSCAWLLAQLSTPACAIMGTIGNGFIEQLDETTHTTPGAIEVQRLLAHFLRAGAATLAMEVSSHALVQHRVNGVAFTDALFTNLSRDHLDYHGDMQRYGAAKAKLFQLDSLRRATINLDDPFGLELLAGLSDSIEPIGYSLTRIDGLAKKCRRLWVEEIIPTKFGMQLKLNGDWGVMEFHAPLMGRFNVSNLLGVLAVLLGRDETVEKLIEKIPLLRPVPGRMQVFRGTELATVVVDYAHTPDALKKVLEALKLHSSSRGKLICLFGCGGERDSGKRPLMGAVAEKHADRLILTDDNPRHENSQQIIEQILAGMKEPAAVQIKANRARAIQSAIKNASAEDLVLIAGKGHERWQQIGDLKHPFDDATEVRKVLKGLLEGKSQ